MLYTTKVIYHKSIFFTDDELGKDVQSRAEEPWIYILANCADTIAEKLSFVDVRRDDAKEMKAPLEIGNKIIHDKLRFFTGIDLVDQGRPPF